MRSSRWAGTRVAGRSSTQWPASTRRGRYAPGVTLERKLIIELPRDGSVERQLEREPPEAIASGEVVVEAGPTDEQGNLEAPAAGRLVYSVPSPEVLSREADEIRHVLRRAGSGAEPLVVAVEAAEELRADELAAVLRAAEHASRPAILRIVRDIRLREDGRRE